MLGVVNLLAMWRISFKLCIILYTMLERNIYSRLTQYNLISGSQVKPLGNRITYKCLSVKFVLKTNTVPSDPLCL